MPIIWTVRTAERRSLSRTPVPRKVRRCNDAQHAARQNRRAHDTKCRSYSKRAQSPRAGERRRNRFGRHPDQFQGEWFFRGDKRSRDRQSRSRFDFHSSARRTSDQPEKVSRADVESDIAVLKVGGTNADRPQKWAATVARDRYRSQQVRWR